MEVQFSEAHAKVLKTVKQQAKSRTMRASSVLKKYANKVLSNSPKRSGKKYRKPGSKRSYTASAPGEPPALRSGNLRNSWYLLPAEERHGDGKTYLAGIHTDVEYAPLLQNGTSKIAARPFDEPIKQAAWAEVKAIFDEPYV